MKKRCECGEPYPDDIDDCIMYRCSCARVIAQAVVEGEKPKRRKGKNFGGLDGKIFDELYTEEYSPKDIDQSQRGPEYVGEVIRKTGFGRRSKSAKIGCLECGYKDIRHIKKGESLDGLVCPNCEGKMEECDE